MKSLKKQPFSAKNYQKQTASQSESSENYYIPEIFIPDSSPIFCAPEENKAPNQATLQSLANFSARRDTKKNQVAPWSGPIFDEDEVIKTEKIEAEPNGEDDLLLIMCNQINEEAKHKDQASSSESLIEIEELKHFLGLLILMKIIKKPSIKDYWSNDNLLATPLFSNIMPRDRFIFIYGLLGETCRYLALENDSENSFVDHTEELALSVFIKEIKKKFQENDPSLKTEFLYVSHFAIPHSGVIDPRFRVTKQGVRLTCLFNMKRRYHSNFELSVGKMTNEKKMHLVNKIISGYEHQGKVIALPQKFITKMTIHALEKSGIHSFGYVKKPISLQQSTELGEFKVDDSKARFALVYLNKNSKVERSLEVAHALSFLEKRNKMLLTNFKPCNLSSKKLANKLFFFIFELAIMNARALFLQKCRSPKKWDRTKFRLSLVHELLGSMVPSKNCEQQRKECKPPESSEFHYPNRSSKRGYCFHCNKSRVNTVCLNCKHFFCIKNCFYEHHVSMQGVVHSQSI